MRGVANVLNRLKYSGDLPKTRIIIINRGTTGNRKTLDGKHILEIRKDRFVCRIDDEETVIPNHRTLEVVLGKQVLWKKRINR